MCMRHNVICGLPGSITFFSTLSYKRQDFEKKRVIELEMCILIFSKFLYENSVIVRRIRRDKIINV